MADRGVGRKASTTVKTSKISVRKPKSFEWVQAHPDADEYSIILPVFEYDATEQDDDKKGITKKILYTVHPDLVDEPDLEDDLTRLREYILATTRKGKLFVWDHGYSDKENSWIDSEEENITKARGIWVRQISNTGEGVYNRKQPLKAFPQPDWEKLIAGRSFDEILIEALGDFFVTSLDHPIFKELLGR
jgi:hypothetical protein